MRTRTVTASRWWLLALVAGSALTLSACNRNDGRTVGEKVDAGIAKTEHAAAEAKAKAEQMAANARAKTDSSSSGAQSSMKQGATDAKEAVKDAGASISATVDDASITAAVSAGLAKDADLSAIKINVDTKGGAVSLKGPAPSAAAKARAEEISKGVKGVSTVDNQLDVKS